VTPHLEPPRLRSHTVEDRDEVSFLAARSFEIVQLFLDLDGFHRIALCDGIDNVLAVENRTEDAMLTVEVWRREVGDEKL
jgi:hypothetical protein